MDPNQQLQLLQMLSGNPNLSGQGAPNMPTAPTLPTGSNAMPPPAFATPQMQQQQQSQQQNVFQKLFGGLLGNSFGGLGIGGQPQQSQQAADPWQQNQGTPFQRSWSDAQRASMAPVTMLPSG